MNTEIVRDDFHVLIPVVMGLIGFMFFWFTQGSSRLRDKMIQKYGQENGEAKLVINSKYLGALTIGLMPLLIYLVVFPDTSMADLGFKLNGETAMLTLFLTIGLGAVMSLLLMYNSRSPRLQAKQPEIRVNEWDKRLVLRLLMAWGVYLLGYEFYFRGLLLYPLVHSIGLWPAIAINVALYSGLHIPKGLDEALGAIPFSIVLCLLGIYTGTFWMSFIVHFVMATTVILSTIKYNPDMKFIGGSRQ